MKWEKFDIRNLSDDEYCKWYSLMSKSKQERVDRFRFDADKKRTVAGEMLARKMISEYCGVTPQDIAFEVSENGKPYAKGLNVHFNISHSEDFVVCAVDNTPVGIDIEKIRPIDLIVAKRICTIDELKYIFEYIPAEKYFGFCEDIRILTRFFEIWTEKEAIYKQGDFEYKQTHINYLDGYLVCIVFQRTP